MQNQQTRVYQKQKGAITSPLLAKKNKQKYSNTKMGILDLGGTLNTDSHRPGQDLGTKEFD